MVELKAIREHMEVIGADGVHVGFVDKVEGDRIKLTRSDVPADDREIFRVDSDGAAIRPDGPHRFLPVALVATVEANHVRLSANAASVALLEEREGGEALVRTTMSPEKGAKGRMPD